MTSQAAALVEHLGGLPPEVNKYFAAAEAIKASIDVRSPLDLFPERGADGAEPAGQGTRLVA